MQSTNDYCITFACYNQIEFTQKFIASLDRSEVDFSRIVAVDNGSSDGTREWLQTLGLGAVILNRQNLGCGAAWNQGAMAMQTKWTVIMNNDVICAKGWLNALLQAAIDQKLQIASPAMVEGEFDYDFDEFVRAAHEKMNGYCRAGMAHAVCMAIHRDVWPAIGYFLPITQLLGYEDALFFRQAQLQKIRMGITANAWLHHFGMTTQKAMKLEAKLSQRDSLGNRNLMKFFMNQSWLERKISQHQKKSALRTAKDNEIAQFGTTVHALKNGPSFQWI
jgi:GT2 family glycosyltransferase